MAEDVKITLERYRFLQEMEAKLVEHVLVSKNRLAELEAAVAKRDMDRELIINEYKQERLRKLREKDKSNSGAVRERVRRFNEKHRDEILEKRKIKRDLKTGDSTETATNTLSIS
jgi:hypothetical protein